jgi:hypothetical protein
MQREIEALLQAWNREQEQANRLFEGLLAAIAAQGQARKHMLDAVAAVSAEANGPVYSGEKSEVLATAVTMLREGRAASPSAH